MRRFKYHPKASLKSTKINKYYPRKNYEINMHFGRFEVPRLALGVPRERLGPSGRRRGRGTEFFERTFCRLWGPWGDHWVTFGVLGAHLGDLWVTFLMKIYLKRLPWIDSEKQTRNVYRIYRQMSGFGKEHDVTLQFLFDACSKINVFAIQEKY